MINTSFMPTLFKDLNLVQLGYQVYANSNLMNMANIRRRRLLLHPISLDHLVLLMVLHLGTTKMLKPSWESQDAVQMAQNLYGGFGQQFLDCPFKSTLPTKRSWKQLSHRMSPPALIFSHMVPPSRSQISLCFFRHFSIQ